MSVKVAVVVATRNRPRHVRELLVCLDRQVLRPGSVTVVDASDVGCGPTAADFACSLQVVRREVTRASLPHQRNIGAGMVLDSECEAVCFLDDDVRPRPDYLSRLADLLQRDTVGVVGGVSGTSGWTQARLRAWHVWYSRLFLLSGKADGRVLRSGYNMPVDANNQGVHKAQWLFGCSMWRAEVLRRHQFSEILPGSALFEDVEFSIRVGKEYLLLVDTGAQLDHLLEMDQRPDMRLHYERMVRNRMEVVRSSGGGGRRWAAFWWSVLGDALQLLRYVHSSADYRARIQGLGRGVAATLARRDPR